MKRSAKCKCLHCRELFVADFRNRGRQRHCGKPQCRKVAKALSQRRWLGKAENQNYFRGPENSARVREWRARHPGYWAKRTLWDAMGYKKAAAHKILQIRRLRQRRRPTRYKNSPSRTLRCLWDLSPRSAGVRYKKTSRASPVHSPQTMKEKPILCPERLRRVPRQFSWIDQRLIRDAHITRCTPNASTPASFRQ
jgi:hypothetical protein